MSSPGVARHLTLPNVLSLIRLLLVPVFLYLLIICSPVQPGTLPANAHHLDQLRWLALGVFAIMAVTDKLDGYLARRLNQISKLGTFLDPAADKLLITGGFVILVFPQFAPGGLAIPWPVLWGVCQKDVCVIIGAAVVKHQLGKVQVNANLWGKINTVVEVVLVIATMLTPEWIGISPLFAAVVLWSLWHLTVLATAAAAVGYSIEGARQLRAGAKVDNELVSPKVPVSPA